MCKATLWTNLLIKVLVGRMCYNHIYCIQSETCRKQSTARQLLLHKWQWQGVWYTSVASCWIYTDDHGVQLSYHVVKVFVFHVWKRWPWIATGCVTRWSATRSRATVLTGRYLTASPYRFLRCHRNNMAATTVSFSTSALYTQRPAYSKRLQVHT